MGNTNEKLRPQSLTLQEFVPPTRQKTSPVLTEMLMRIVRKIEGENYLWTPNPSFTPKYIYLDLNPGDPFTQVEKAEFDRTQPLYGLAEAAGGNEKTFNLKEEYNDSNSKALTKSSSKDFSQDKTLQRSQTKENKGNSSSRLKNPPSQQGFMNAPKGVDSRNNKFFVSQNKANTTKNSKAPLPKPDNNSKGPLKHNANMDTLNAQKNKNNLNSLFSPSNVMEDDNDGTNFGMNLERQPMKRKFLVNCELEKRIFCLPHRLQFTIFSFIIDEYVKLILVSPIWYYKINELYESHLLALDNAFIKTYMDVLAFKRSYFSISPYKFSNKTGFRMDRNMVAEVLHPLVGKTVVLSYTYELTRKKGVQYKAIYKFDVVKKGSSRQIWIHKEESKPFFDEGKSAFVQPIMPVCATDNIKFALSFYNMNGLVNISTIEWKPPIIEAIPSIPKELHSNFLQGIDKNRICEMEEISDEWILFKYFESKHKQQYEFDPQLLTYETRCSGIDIVTNKTTYLANQPGEVKKAFGKLGINIFVEGARDEIVTEIKRFGLYQDLENFIQLRQGDKLVLYLTKGE